MSDLIDDPESAGNAPEYTVSEISGAVKRTIEGAFTHVRVKGEVGRVSRPRSGHVYLDLKDDKAVLAGILWKGVADRLSIQPEEGMEVVASGRLTTYPGQSRYQIIIDDLKPAGVGALMAMLEARKKALAAEGLFDPARKRPLPYLPDVIGVVTSPSGAVIRDILHRLRDRFPRKVLIWPVAVQGENCAPEVANAIRGFNTMTPGGALPRPDLLIVARGGGSIEDLWGFNEEIVARAAAASEIPLISAVGHETDTTLIDYVSDRRAPTPTAAAEMAVPVRLELLAWLDQQGARLSQSLGQSIQQRGQRLRDMARALPRPEGLLDLPRQRMDNLGERLPAGLSRLIQARHLDLSRSAGALRPAALARLVANDQRRLEMIAARLTPEILTREHSRKRQDFNRLTTRFQDIAKRQVKEASDRLTSLDRLRETLGYKETLRRGYAVVRTGKDVVTTRTQAAEAQALEIEFTDGRLSLGPTAPIPSDAPKVKKPPSEPSSDQGSLF